MPTKMQHFTLPFVVACMLPLPTFAQLSTTVTDCVNYGDQSSAGTLFKALAANSGTIDFNCSGMLTVPEIILTTDTTINGQADLILSGDSNNRVLTIPEGVNVEINNLEVANGYSNSGAGDGTDAGGRGGGIYNSGTLKLSGVTVRNNRAETGGGINNNGILEVMDVVIRDNLAAYTGGLHNNGNVTGSDLIIQNNISNGAIVDSYGLFDITRCEFTEHRENSSPAISNHADGFMVLNHCTLKDNATSMIDNEGTLKITESIFRNNGGSQSQIWNTGRLEVNTTTFSDNTDLKPTIQNGALAKLNNVTISGNLLTAIDNSGTMVVQSSTITGQAVHDILTNYLIYNTGELNLGNTIVAGANEVAECGGTSPVVSDGYNLHTDGSCTALPSTDIAFGKPLLAPLADNGGAGRTHRLLDGSDAIDNGNCEAGGVPTDQRAIARPQGPGCDIGAFEQEVSTQAFCGFDATDPDGDGWGRNGVGSVSCRMQNDTSLYCTNPDSDPDGDGWGWENNKSCLVKLNLSFCASKDSDSNGDGWGWENGESCVVKVHH